MNFAPGEIWHLRIEQRRQGAQDTAFGLPAQPQQNKIVTRENRVDDLRHDRIVVSHDAGEYRRIALLAQARDQVVSQFVFNPPCAKRSSEKTLRRRSPSVRGTLMKGTPTNQQWCDYTPALRAQLIRRLEEV
jgi:hypothetical protein